MKRLFNTNYNHQSLDIALLILRVGIGSFMLTHGMAKLGPVLEGQPIQFGDPIGIGTNLSFFLAVFAEVLCAVLLILGLFTRLALIPLIITMVIAAFIVHGADPFQKKEVGFMYMVVFVFLLIAGPGRYSIDSIISQKSNRRRSF